MMTDVRGDIKVLMGLDTESFYRFGFFNLHVPIKARHEFKLGKIVVFCFFFFPHGTLKKQ